MNEQHSFHPYDVRFADAVRALLRTNSTNVINRERVRNSARTIATAMIEPKYETANVSVQTVVGQWQTMQESLFLVAADRQGALDRLRMKFKTYRIYQADNALALVKDGVISAQENYRRTPISRNAGAVIETQAMLDRLKVELVEFRANGGMVDWGQPVEPHNSLVDAVTRQWHRDHSKVIDLVAEASPMASAREL